jgi:hypothetical protein
MTKDEFLYACNERCIDPELALHFDEVRKALASKNKRLVLYWLDQLI